MSDFSRKILISMAFGCWVYPNLCLTQHNKFSAKSNANLFIGYPKHYSGYMLLDPLFEKIKILCDILFIEDDFSLSTLVRLSDQQHQISPPSSSQVLLLPLVRNPYIDDVHVMEDDNTGPNIDSGNIKNVVQSRFPFISDESQNDNPTTNSLEITIESFEDRELSNTTNNSSSDFGGDYINQIEHTMITRSRIGVVKPNPQYALQILASSKISTLIAKQKNDPIWNEAMDLEILALEQNKTWELVPKSSHQNLLTCKWLFKLKQDDQGCKARLVANGMRQ